LIPSSLVARICIPVPFPALSPFRLKAILNATYYNGAGIIW
jgi:hypothetical protein